MICFIIRYYGKIKGELLSIKWVDKLFPESCMKIDENLLVM